MFRNFIFFQKEALHVIIASSIVFLFLNVFENVIHYSIGRGSSNEEGIKLHMPSFTDAIKIMGVMLVFGILQGVFTYLFMKRL